MWDEQHKIQCIFASDECRIYKNTRDTEIDHKIEAWYSLDNTETAHYTTVDTCKTNIYPIAINNLAI